MAGLVKDDGTVDTDKFAQQFMDYGYPVPDNLHDSAKFNIYTEAELLTEKIYPFTDSAKEVLVQFNKIYIQNSTNVNVLSKKQQVTTWG